MVEDDSSLCEILMTILKAHARVLSAHSGADAIAIATRSRIDVAFVDLGLPGGMDGLALLEQLREIQPEMEVIICTVDRAIATVVKAIKAGAFDYITKDFSSLQATPLLVERAMKRQQEKRELANLRSELAKNDQEIVGGEHEPMRSVLNVVRAAAATDSTVLLLGESGTGKELIARQLHRWSTRSKRPFVAVNLAAIPENLLESTLFGHQRGAFTGAHENHLGKFELAEGGTLFLDEVAELEKGLQAKLLRVIQERQLDRVGSETPIDIDVRLIAATNVDLNGAVQSGAFRGDLFYRLNVVPIRLPALRDRRNDLPPLIYNLTKKHAARAHRRAPVFAPETIAMLAGYPWPGNIRELENLVERMMVLCAHDTIRPEDLPVEYSVHPETKPGHLPARDDDLATLRDSFERTLIVEALAHTKGNRSAAARLLGMPFSTFKYKMHKHQLQ